MFKLNSKLTMACSAAVLALAMTACSSSSDDNPPMASNVPDAVDPAPPTPVAVDLTALTAGYVLVAGTVEVAAGGTFNHGDVSFTCSGDEACTVVVADDGTCTSTGGTVTAENSPAYVAKLRLNQHEMDAADALAAVQTDAADAAAAAKTAADASAADAKAAMEAGTNLATLQTGAKSAGLAEEAATAADNAMTAVHDG